MNWFLFTTATDSWCKTEDIWFMHLTINSTAARNTWATSRNQLIHIQAANTENSRTAGLKRFFLIVEPSGLTPTFPSLITERPHIVLHQLMGGGKKEEQTVRNNTNYRRQHARKICRSYIQMHEEWKMRVVWKHSPHDGKPQQPHPAAKWWRDSFIQSYLYALSEKKVWSLNTETECVLAGSKGDGPQSSGSASIRIRTAAIADQSQISSVVFTNT